MFVGATEHLGVFVDSPQQSGLLSDPYPHGRATPQQAKAADQQVEQHQRQLQARHLAVGQPVFALLRLLDPAILGVQTKADLVFASGDDGQGADVEQTRVKFGFRMEWRCSRRIEQRRAANLLLQRRKTGEVRFFRVGEITQGQQRPIRMHFRMARQQRHGQHPGTMLAPDIPGHAFFHDTACRLQTQLPTRLRIGEDQTEKTADDGIDQVMRVGKFARSSALLTKQGLRQCESFSPCPACFDGFCCLKTHDKPHLIVMMSYIHTIDDKCT